MVACPDKVSQSVLSLPEFASRISQGFNLGALTFALRIGQGFNLGTLTIRRDGASEAAENPCFA
jgi:hypothetical protein